MIAVRAVACPSSPQTPSRGTRARASISIEPIPALLLELALLLEPTTVLEPVVMLEPALLLEPTAMLDPALTLEPAAMLDPALTPEPAPSLAIPLPFHSLAAAPALAPDADALTVVAVLTVALALALTAMPEEPVSAPDATDGGGHSPSHQAPASISALVLTPLDAAPLAWATT